MWRLQPLTAVVVDGGGVRQPPPRLVRVRPRTARRRTARPATDHCPPKLRDRRRPDELRHRPRRGALCPRSHRRPRSLRQRTALECLPNGWSSGAAGAWRPRKRLSCTSKLSQAFVPGSCELTVTWPASGPLGGLLPKKPGQEWLPPNRTVRQYLAREGARCKAKNRLSPPFCGRLGSQQPDHPDRYEDEA